MDVPEGWRSYNCADYFRSPLSETGWWDPEGQCWYIEPAPSVREDLARELLVIGRPGVDGIEWGYRRGEQGIWAHYPIGDTFRFVAASAEDLRDGYSSGRIKV
jgi:hypothetical protein